MWISSRFRLHVTTGERFKMLLVITTAVSTWVSVRPYRKFNPILASFVFFSEPAIMSSHFLHNLWIIRSVTFSWDDRITELLNNNSVLPHRCISHHPFRRPLYTGTWIRSATLQTFFVLWTDLKKETRRGVKWERVRMWTACTDVSVLQKPQFHILSQL